MSESNQNDEFNILYSKFLSRTNRKPNPNEAAALILLALSRDRRSWCTSTATAATSAANNVENIEEKNDPSSSVTSTLVNVDDDKKLHTCNVCGDCFPSHQALGGHKTKHRKRSPPPTAVESHACLTCHQSFSSGQALGGHMRRHYVAGEKQSNEGATSDDGVQQPSLEIGLGLDQLLLDNQEEEEDIYSEEHTFH